MNNNTKVSKILAVAVIGLVFTSQPAFASISYHNRDRHNGRDHYRRDRDRHDHGRHQRHHRHHRNRPYVFGSIIWELPHGVISVSSGGKRYHYHDGHYFRRYSGGYEVIRPPRGACFSRLPNGYEMIYVNGIPYYMADGIYYKDTPQGFMVIERPVEKVVVSHEYKGPEVKGEAITVKIPNEKGGYTSVTITKTDNGFLGPQGEFYDEFPEIAQLKVMYGT